MGKKKGAIRDLNPGPRIFTIDVRVFPPETRIIPLDQSPDLGNANVKFSKLWGKIRGYPKLGRQKKKRKEKKKTYNTGDSLVVTDPTTDPALSGLSMGERTGSRVLHWVWSYVKCLVSSSTYIAQELKRLTSDPRSGVGKTRMFGPRPPSKRTIGGLGLWIVGRSRFLGASRSGG